MNSINNYISVYYFTFNRSEFGLMKVLLEDFELDKRFNLKLLIGGSHINAKYGNTKTEIDNSKIKKKIYLKTKIKNTSQESINKYLFESHKEIHKYFIKNKPNLVLLMGDRYELLPIINSSLILNIPIAHISGGEITEGAIDNQIRNIITKASHLHFVANSNFQKRLFQMGEEKWRVKITGEPGLEKIKQLKKIKKNEIEKKFGFSLDNSILLTYHPVTYEANKNISTIKNILQALNYYKFNIIITASNSDHGGDDINFIFKKYVKKNKRAIFIDNLGFDLYHNVLKHIRFLIGNSSSGIVEAASYNLPVINIGNRQKGRPYTENVFHSSINAKDIHVSINKALKFNLKVKNIYFQKNSSELIRNKIMDIFNKKDILTILSKKFIDIF